MGRFRMHPGRIVVWLVVLVVTTASAVQVGMFTSPPTPEPSPVAAGVVTQTPLGPPAPEDWHSAVAAYHLREGSSIDLLPSYRWRGAANLQAGKSSFLGVTLPNPSEELGAVLFDIAGLFWALILVIARAVYSIDLLAGAIGVRINAFFLQLSDAVTRAGMIALLSIAIIAHTGLRYLKNPAGSRAVSTALSLFLPLALLVALTAGARQQVQVDKSGVDCSEVMNDPVGSVIPEECLTGMSGSESLRSRAAQYAPGSPVWLASTSLGLVDLIASPLYGAFNSVSANPAASTADGNALGCEAYEEQLYVTFTNAWSQERVNLGFSPLAQAAPLQTISEMWEDSFKAFFDDMQYSGSVSGRNISCRQLENQAGVRPFVQAALSHMAGAPPGGTDPAKLLPVLNRSQTEATLLDGDDNCGALEDDRCPLAPFQSYGGSDSADRRAYLMAFGACTFHDGQFKIQGAWGVVGGVDADGCERFWKQGGTAGGKLKFTNTSPLTLLERGSRVDVTGSWAACAGGASGSFPHEDGTIPCAQVYPGNLGDSETGMGAARVALNFQGRNAASTSPFIAGLMALLTSLAFLWVLLGVLLGMLIAKIGFSLLVGLLPGVLLLMAVPSKNATRSQLGSRMFKLMTSWGLASLLLGLVMSFILVLMRFVKMLMGGGGTVGSFTTLLTPVVALVMTHILFKKLGLGKGFINPLGGAGLAFAAASAIQAKPNQDRVKAAAAGYNKPGKWYEDGKTWATKTGRRLKTAANRVATTPAGSSAYQTARNKGEQDELGVFGAALVAFAAPTLRETRRKNERELEGARIDSEIASDAAARGATAKTGKELDLVSRGDTAKYVAEQLDRAPRTDAEKQAATKQARQHAAQASQRAAGPPADDPMSEFAQRNEQLLNAPDGQRMRELMRSHRKNQLTARDRNGNMVPLANGEHLMALVDPTTGELVRGDALTDMVTQLAATGQPFELAAAAAGYRTVSTADMDVFDWGDHYQQELQTAASQEWAVDQGDVIALADGTSPIPLPNFGMATTPSGLSVLADSQLIGGRTLPASASAETAGQLLRSWTSHLDQGTRLRLSSVAPDDLPFVMAELDSMFRDSDGRQVNALELLGLDATTLSTIDGLIATGHTFSEADLGRELAGHHITIDTSVLTAAIASGHERARTAASERRAPIQDLKTTIEATVNIARTGFNDAVTVGVEAFELLQQHPDGQRWAPENIAALNPLIDRVAVLLHADEQLKVMNRFADDVTAGRAVNPDALSSALEAAEATVTSFRASMEALLTAGNPTGVAEALCREGGVPGQPGFAGDLVKRTDPSSFNSATATAGRRISQLAGAIPNPPTPRPNHRSNVFP